MADLYNAYIYTHTTSTYMLYYNIIQLAYCEQCNALFHAIVSCTLISDHYILELGPTEIAINKLQV